MRALSLIAVSFFAPVVASAHGFGARIDLPIPLGFYLIGAGVTVLVSFLLIGFIRHKGDHLDHYPRLNLLEVSWLDFLRSHYLKSAIKIFFVLYTILLVIAGILGSQVDAENIISTSTWIFFGVGMTYFSAFIGNLWAFINPWKTVYGWLEKSLGRIESVKKEWPEQLGYWPAVLMFFIYRWIENVYPGSAEPSFIATMLILYTLVTFAGMKYFGKENWLKYGDGFSVFFNLLSKFSITEYRKVEGKEELNLRPLAVGLFSEEKINWTLRLFVMLMLSTLAFDGLEATPVWRDFSLFVSNFVPSSYFIGTLGLLAVLLFFILTYSFFSYLIKVFSGSSKSGQIISFRFLYSLLPIAIAYELAHFISLLLIEGQRIIYLISDPLGRGWNLLSTAEYGINYNLINLKFLWNAQVALIVLGHIVSVYVAHIVASHFFGERRIAVKSQYPVLLLMVLYTIFSLWIIAQPIVVGA